jgi:hypothetical protein
MAVLTSNTFNCSSPTCAGVENGWVYVRSGTTWTQQKTKSPVPDGGPIEGNLALEDLPDPVAVSPGSVLVGRRLFALTSTSWQSVTLPPFDAGGGNLSVGASVARSGSTVVIGAPTNGNPLTAGAVLVYSCSP